MALHGVCATNTPIERVDAATLSDADFRTRYFSVAKPVILTGATDHWPARKWTIESLVERVGDTDVWVRENTDQYEYRVGKKYSVRKDKFHSYCHDLLEGNERARSSYLAVASIHSVFPELEADVKMPEFGGKLHLGPYMWLAMKGHYEFTHFDPSDNFLVMIQGRKQVRLFGIDIENLYPNPLGSYGKTVQSQVHCDEADLKRFPLFAKAHCQHCVLEPGEMLFIPAFYWHQVSALDTGISVNIFYGDSGQNAYLEKVTRPPYQSHAEYWLFNVIEQNRSYESFERMLPRLPEVLKYFFFKQWHEIPTDEQLERMTETVMRYLGIEELPSVAVAAKFPPPLKIRGLLHRNGTDKQYVPNEK